MNRNLKTKPQHTENSYDDNIIILWSAKHTAVLTTRSLSMAAESLSPVALKSKTLATGPLQHKHVRVVGQKK